MNFDKPKEVVAVAGAAGEALEANDAAQAGDEDLDTAVIGWHRPFLDGVVVERRKTAPHDVNYARPRLGAKVCPTNEVLVLKRRIVTKANGTKPPKRGQHPAIVLRVFRNQNDETRVLGDHRRRR